MKVIINQKQFLELMQSAMITANREVITKLDDLEQAIYSLNLRGVLLDKNEITNEVNKINNHYKSRKIGLK